MKKPKRKVWTPKARKGRLFEGLPVVDADHDIALVITKADVSASTVKDPGNCAAARAGRRELKRDVRVFLSRMYVKEEDRHGARWVRYLTPENAAREIVSFDRGSAFVPGEYNFVAPRLGQRLGAPRGLQHQETGTEPKKNRPHAMTTNVRPSAHTHYN